MSKSDQWVIITISLLIILHLAVLIIGYFTGKFTYFASFLNAAAGVSIILYWAISQMQIVQHTIEPREIIVLLIEFLLIGAAVLYIVNQSHNWLMILQRIIFGIHLSLLITGLIFMLTFKMNKLI